MYVRVLVEPDSFLYTYTPYKIVLRRFDMNERFPMQGGKNWILPKEMNANRFFWDSHWLEIWSNHLFLSMGPNGGIVYGLCKESAQTRRVTYKNRKFRNDLSYFSARISCPFLLFYLFPFCLTYYCIILPSLLN